MLLAWINLIVYYVAWIGWFYLYMISLQPKKFESKFGEETWKKCASYRKMALYPAAVQIICYIFWFFLPVEPARWSIAATYLPAILIALGMTAVFAPIMIKGTRDAGKETLVPSKETTMYGGIYKYLRHPQVLGEWPLFVAMAFGTNSWLMVIISLIFVVITAPLMVYLEEIDLVKRFGDSYQNYQKQTHALIPKFTSN